MGHKCNQYGENYGLTPGKEPLKVSLEVKSMFLDPNAKAQETKKKLNLIIQEMKMTKISRNNERSLDQHSKTTDNHEKMNSYERAINRKLIREANDMLGISL